MAIPIARQRVRATVTRPVQPSGFPPVYFFDTHVGESEPLQPGSTKVCELLAVLSNRHLTTETGG
jgi:hypothetical protein